MAILTDQGKHFINEVFEQFSTIFRIDRYCSSVYHPQSNGSIERMHQGVHEYLRIFQENYNTWDVLLPLAQHSYNTAKHEGLNYTPHEIVFLEKARTPSSYPPKDYLQTYDDYLADMTATLAQLRTLAGLNLIQAKHRSKIYYDRRNNVKHFRQGEMVYIIRKPRKGKNESEYVGPCEIISINYNTHNVTLRRNGKEKVFHADLIKHANDIETRIPKLG